MQAQRSYQYNKAWVILSDVSPKAQRRATLFENTATLAKRDEINRTIDELNGRYGRGTVALAGGYTTDWNGLVTAS